MTDEKFERYREQVRVGYLRWYNRIDPVSGLKMGTLYQRAYRAARKAGAPIWKWLCNTPPAE